MCEKERKTFDWLIDPKLTVETVLPYLTQTKNIPINLLDLGTGSSLFPLELSQHLTKSMNLFCLDYVNESLEFQKKIFFERAATQVAGHSPGIYFLCADAKYIPFRANSFSSIYDKGTTDSLLKDKLKGKEETKTVLLEVLRVLCKNGKLLQFTDEDPDARIPLLEECCNVSFKISIHYKILCVENVEYFMYCIKKL